MTPLPPEVVEAAARAMCKVAWSNKWFGSQREADEHADEFWEEYVEAATAALEAALPLLMEEMRIPLWNTLTKAGLSQDCSTLTLRKIAALFAGECRKEGS